MCLIIKLSHKICLIIFQELLKKNKELQDAESVINQQKEKINILSVQQQDEVDALQKKLQSNKCALDAMKKTLDNEKAFRICADQEIKNLKEQIKCNANKYKDLENENEKLVKDKLKLEETKSKINQQCSELIQKNISLENHCEKKELAFDEQIDTINQLENNISELNEKINNCVETEKENDKLIKQIKLFSKQMENYENEREVYVQRLQKIQKEENELKCIIKDFKKEIDLKNDEINILNENNIDLNSKNSMLVLNMNNLKTNFNSCLQLLDEIIDNYVKNQEKPNNQCEIYNLPSKLEPLLNETFELFEQTLIEYKKFKLFHKESEMTLKDDINQKEKIIKSLKDKVEKYKHNIIKNKISNSENLEINNTVEKLIHKKSQLEPLKIDELERNLMYINQIKIEIIPKQKLLVSECQKFMLEKIEEINSLCISKNNYVENILLKLDFLEKEIDNKNISIKELKSDISKLEEKIMEKEALCNEMETELQHFRDNFGIYFSEFN